MNTITNSLSRKLVSNILSCVNLVETQFVRYRSLYYEEKIAKGPCVKNFGYEDRVSRRGLLPRLKDAERLPGPIYMPHNAWEYRRVRQGQNDYIDLLGGGKLRPPDVCYSVPKWLRGRRGNELQLLLLKQKVFSNTLYEYESPTRWKSMSRRVLYLYRYLNRKTKTGFDKKQ